MSMKTQKWCETRVELTKCSLQWTINNLSHYDTEDIGFYLKSSTFNSDENDKSKWHLRIYPKGFNDDDKDYVSLFLYNKSNDAIGVKYKMELALLNDQREKIYIIEGKHIISHLGFGVHKLIKKDYLFDTANGLLKNDQLIVYCEVTEYGNSVTIDGVNTLIQCDPETQLSHDFRNLFKSKEFSDVIIDVNGHEYSAHKLVLSARSPVFAAMFRNHMKENIQNRIEINHMSGDVIQEMLRYIYTGKVPKLNKMAYNLFIAADKYDLKQLKIMCADSVRTNLCIETAADALILSDMHSAKELKEIVVQYFYKNIFEIGKTNGWKRMAIERPQLVASLFIDSNN